jgi:hypothetical protein
MKHFVGYFAGFIDIVPSVLSNDRLMRQLYARHYARWLKNIWQIDSTMFIEIEWIESGSYQSEIG